MATWKAPEAMNRMWSVFTGPYLVETVVPSISGSRSRCTPSRLTSAPPTPAARAAADLVDLVDEDDAVLLDRGDRLADHAAPGRAACRSPRRSAARSVSATVILRRSCVRPPKALPNMSPRLSMPICAPGMPGISKVGRPPRRCPATCDLDLACRRARRRAACLRNFCRVSALAPAPTRASSTRSSAAISAFGRDLLAQPLARSWRCAISTRSRTICSTSRPT